MNQAAPYFTAAQIAGLLNRTRQSVASSLATVPADGCQIISGATVKAWSLAALPSAIQSELEAAALGRGYRHAAAMLSDPAALAPEWQPAVKLADVAPGAMGKALQLQRSLARMIARRNEPGITAAQLEQIGMAIMQKNPAMP